MGKLLNHFDLGTVSLESNVKGKFTANEFVYCNVHAGIQNIMPSGRSVITALFWGCEHERIATASVATFAV